ncbi:Hypothetical predicted protein [Pelobates cultripes]|uniref:Uncharacterized protein n=1 Tax=Pelobates cultripes TaxID=61616 RepID=A0AAD1TF15_PELCU|nr:Hypothetical predicted protein [Pelobates cultripes]
MRGVRRGRSPSPEILQTQTIPPFGPSGVITVHHGTCTSLYTQDLLDGCKREEATTLCIHKMAALHTTKPHADNAASQTRAAGS